MPHSQAHVETQRPARYGKQLASHLGRRVDAEWNEESGHGALTFPSGTGTMTAEPGALTLALEAGDGELARLEDVVGRHLVRFGVKDELVVSWKRDNGEPGQTFRNDGE